MFDGIASLCYTDVRFVALAEGTTPGVMPDRVVSVLYVLGGLVSVGIGWWDARQRIRIAQRIYSLNGIRTSVMPDGWGPWYGRGFASITLGTSWFIALLLTLFWALLGAGLIILGFAWHLSG